MSQRELFKQALNDCWQKDASPDSVLQNLRNLSLEITPNYLFRYRECNDFSFESLRNGSLSFSSPATFPDPEDSSIAISDETLSLIKQQALSDPMFTLLSMALRSKNNEELRRHIEDIPGTSGLMKSFFEELMQRNLLSGAKRFVEMDDDQIRHQIAQIIDDVNYYTNTDIVTILRNVTRVACLCENYNSNKMWEKYAGNGTGFQIAYSKNNLFGIGTDLFDLPVIFPVIYEKKRPEMPSQLMTILFAMFNQQVVAPSLAFQTQLFVSYLPILYFKQENPYSFEQEWRITLNNQTLNERTKQFTSRMCPCSFIRIGPNTSAENIRILQSLADNLGIPLISNEYKEETVCD